MENFIVTTTRKPAPATKIFDEEISSKLGGRLVEHENNSFDALKKFTET